MTGRKSLFSGAPFAVSISKNKRLQELFTGMIGVARLFFVNAYPCLFWVSKC